MNETQPDLDSWEDFSGKYLKVEHIKTWPALFIPISVKSNYDADDKPHLIYTGEYAGKKKDFEPNQTNKDIIKKAGILSPKAAIGKKFYFKQVMNFNPTLKKKVPSLEIERIE